MLRDLVERALRAFAVAFFGVLVVVAPTVDLSTARAAAASAFAAGASAVLSLVASVFGVRGSASLDPANHGTVTR